MNKYLAEWIIKSIKPNTLPEEIINKAKEEGDKLWNNKKLWGTKEDILARAWLEGFVFCLKGKVTITDEDKKNKIKKLKENFTKLLDYTMQYVDICDVCPVSSTCINSEGTCPMAGYKGSLKPLLLKQLGIIEKE